MDLSFLEMLIPNFAEWLGIHPSTLLFLIGFVMANAHIIGKLIPDDAVGWKGYVREVCKIIGMAVSNRVTSGVSTAAVVRTIVGAQFDRAKANAIVGKAAEASSLVPQVVDDITDESPRLVRDPIGQYARRKMLNPAKDESDANDSSSS